MSDEPAKTASEAADQRHRELAREEGEAYRRSMRHLVEDVAHSGATEEVSDYVVAVGQEEATGSYRRQDGELSFVEPTAENCYLAVPVADAVDGRFVPHLSVSATLSTADGETIGPVDLPFRWHPGLYHYGSNLTVPGDGTYDVEVRIDAPSFGRRDRENGDRYRESVTVQFADLDVACGQA